MFTRVIINNPKKVLLLLTALLVAVVVLSVNNIHMKKTWLEPVPQSELDKGVTWNK